MGIYKEQNGQIQAAEWADTRRGMDRYAEKNAQIHAESQSLDPATDKAPSQCIRKESSDSTIEFDFKKPRPLLE